MFDLFKKKNVKEETIKEEKKGDKKMAKMFSENAQALLTFLQANQGANLTSYDIADALGLTRATVDGVATGLKRKGLADRKEVEGIEKKVIYLTDAGINADPNADAPEKDAE